LDYPKSVKGNLEKVKKKKEELNPAFSKRIKIILEELEMTQLELAQKMDFSQGIISEFTSGTRNPSKEFILGLSKFGVSIDWFLSGVDPIFLPGSDKKSQRTPLTPKNLTKIDQQLEKIKAEIKEIQDYLNEISKDPPDSGTFVSDPEPDYCNIPFMQNVAAGPPIAQSEDLSDTIPVPRQFFRKKRVKPEKCYAVRVKGESMTKKIPDDSIVLIRRSGAPKNGAIQVVRCGGSSTRKRMLEHEDGSWTLKYENGSIDRIKLGPGEEYEVQGDFVDILPEEWK
jgi:SOS-response transcriptional repressor LexA